MADVLKLQYYRIGLVVRGVFLFDATNLPYRKDEMVELYVVPALSLETATKMADDLFDNLLARARLFGHVDPRFIHRRVGRKVRALTEAETIALGLRT